MSETDTIKIGEPLPGIVSVTAHDRWTVTVTLADGNRRLVDLAPVIFTYKFYRPLRENPDLFKTVHVANDGSAIAWGDDDEIDMDASTVTRLAEEAMEPADFAAFLKRQKLTFEAASAQLGISRRLVAYYASERQVPRYIALACAYLDQKLGDMQSRSEESLASVAEEWLGNKFVESVELIWQGSQSQEHMPDIFVSSTGKTDFARAAIAKSPLTTTVPQHVKKRSRRRE